MVWVCLCSCACEEKVSLNVRGRTPIGHCLKCRVLGSTFCSFVRVDPEPCILSSYLVILRQVVCAIHFLKTSAFENLEKIEYLTLENVCAYVEQFLHAIPRKSKGFPHISNQNLKPLCADMFELSKHITHHLFKTHSRICL